MDLSLCRTLDLRLGEAVFVLCRKEELEEDNSSTIEDLVWKNLAGIHNDGRLAEEEVSGYKLECEPKYIQTMSLSAIFSHPDHPHHRWVSFSRADLIRCSPLAV